MLILKERIRGHPPNKECAPARDSVRGLYEGGKKEIRLHEALGTVRKLLLVLQEMAGCPVARVLPGVSFN